MRFSVLVYLLHEMERYHSCYCELRWRLFTEFYTHLQIQTRIERIEDMLSFTNDDKATIKNDYEEKGWTAYKICKEHLTKEWVLRSVQRLQNKYKETGTMERKAGSGRPMTAKPFSISRTNLELYSLHI